MPSNSDQILGRRTMAWLVLVGGAAFCAFLFLLVVDDPAKRDVTSTSSYSRSAIGHAAFVALLRDIGYPVAVNRDRRAARMADDDLLLVLEPDLGHYSVDDLRRLIHDKRRVLLALPKWRARTGQAPRGWIGAAELVPTSEAAKVASATIRRPEVNRPESEDAWSIRFLASGAPQLDSPQLLTGTPLTPLAANAEGVLAGEIHHFGEVLSRIVLLADPDVIANHGLHRGDNAALAVALVDRLMDGSAGTIHVDETLHGFAISPTLPRLMFVPPFLAATLLALAAVAIAIWRATVRFGSPFGDEAEPVHRSGHATLLQNAGRLLASANHGAHIARRYVAASVEEAARALHLRQTRGSSRPGGTGRANDDLRGMLAAIAQRRGVRARLPDDESERPLTQARRTYDWMEEMLGGSRPRRHAR